MVLADSEPIAVGGGYEPRSNEDTKSKPALRLTLRCLVPLWPQILRVVAQTIAALADAAFRSHFLDPQEVDADLPGLRPCKRG